MLLVIANLLERYKNIARCGNRNHAWGKVSPYVEGPNHRSNLTVVVWKDNLEWVTWLNFVNSACGEEKLL